jgi:Ca2+-binding EF-hand superfamily protein
MERSMVSPRALIRRHKNPVEAFEAVDTAGTGSLDLKRFRESLQNLGIGSSAVECAALAKKYGDGKNVDYRRFLVDHEIPLSPTAKHIKEYASHLSGGPLSSPSGGAASSRPTSPKPIPGNPARRDTYDPSAVAHTGKTAHFLRFESDSHDFPHYFHGNPGIELALPAPSLRGGKRLDYPQRELDYSKHKLAVVGSDLKEIEAAHAHEDGDVRAYARVDGSGATSVMEDPLYRSGLLCEAGGVGNYINDAAGVRAIGDDYLPTFPGENFPRRKPVDPVLHGGRVAKAGGLTKFFLDESWKEEHPEGYLPALPNGIIDEPRAIVYDPQNQAGALIGHGSAGTAVWASDTESMDRHYDALRRVKYDPLYHSGELARLGGISGVANAGRTWLQDTPTAPGMQVQITPPHIRARSKSAARERGKGRAASRRRSVPDLLAGRYNTKPLAQALREDGAEDVDGGEDGGDGPDAYGEDGVPFAEVNAEEGGLAAGDLVSGIARRNRAVYTSALSEAGPLTDATGLHHERMSHALGARSPVAVALAAAPLAKFDARKLALVRQHIRARLPQKAAAAVAALKHRLVPRASSGGAGDGKVTDSELMSSLTQMMPDLHAEEVGLLIRYMRQRNSKRQVAAREDASSRAAAGGAGGAGAGPAGGGRAGAASSSSSSSRPLVAPEEVAQMTVSTAGFGDGIDVSELAEWIAKQPGGQGEITSPLYATGPHTITSFSASPPTAKEDEHDPFTHHTTKRRVSPDRNLAPRDSPNETREHARPAFDSTAAAQVLFGDGAPFVDPRVREADDFDYDGDVGSLLSAHTLTSARSRAKKAHSYEDYHRLRRQASAAVGRGDADAPAAGLLCGEKKKKAKNPAGKDGEDGAAGTTTDRTETHTRFEAFRATWEGRHGAAAKKEMRLDREEPAEGPTWTRSTPQPFKVVHLAKGPMSGGV